MKRSALLGLVGQRSVSARDRFFSREWRFPTHAAPDDPGAATFTASAPAGSVGIGDSAEVSINHTSFTPGTLATWAGYVRHPLRRLCETATADVIGVSNPCDASGEYRVGTASGLRLRLPGERRLQRHTRDNHLQVRRRRFESDPLHGTVRERRVRNRNRALRRLRPRLHDNARRWSPHLWCGWTTSPDQHAGAHLYADVDEDAVHTTSNAHDNENAGGHASADRPAYADPHTDADGQHVPPDTD